MSRRALLPAVLATALLAFAAPALAQGETGGETTPEDLAMMGHEEMMKMYEASMTPGPQHERLAWFAGDWTATIRSFWGPEPTVNAGTSHVEMQLGGRYLLSTHHSEMEGMPFEGRAIDGFDNTSGKYFNLWYDSMGTGYMLTHGEPSADGKVQGTSGEWVDPMMGPMKVRFVTTITGENSYRLEMYMQAEDQEEMKSMEIDYERAGS